MSNLPEPDYSDYEYDSREDKFFLNNLSKKTTSDMTQKKPQKSDANLIPSYSKKSERRTSSAQELAKSQSKNATTNDAFKNAKATLSFTTGPNDTEIISTSKEVNLQSGSEVTLKIEKGIKTDSKITVTASANTSGITKADDKTNEFEGKGKSQTGDEKKRKKRLSIQLALEAVEYRKRKSETQEQKIIIDVHKQNVDDKNLNQRGNFPTTISANLSLDKTYDYQKEGPFQPKNTSTPFWKSKGNKETGKKALYTNATMPELDEKPDFRAMAERMKKGRKEMDSACTGKSSSDKESSDSLEAKSKTGKPSKITSPGSQAHKHNEMTKSLEDILKQRADKITKEEEEMESKRVRKHICIPTGNTSSTSTSYSSYRSSSSDNENYQEELFHIQSKTESKGKLGNECIERPSLMKDDEKPEFLDMSRRMQRERKLKAFDNNPQPEKLLKNYTVKETETSNYVKKEVTTNLQKEVTTNIKKEVKTNTQKKVTTNKPSTIISPGSQADIHLDMRKSLESVLELQAEKMRQQEQDNDIAGNVKKQTCLHSGNTTSSSYSSSYLSSSSSSEIDDDGLYREESFKLYSKIEKRNS